MGASLSRYLTLEALSQLDGLALLPRSLVAGNLAGAHRSPLSGFAVEFAGHREYVPGDDPKHVDWRVYYTRDRYFVKQYELETNLVCHLVLDISASMRYGEGARQKLAYAAALAAAISYLVVRQNDKVSLAVFDDQVRGVVPPGGTPAQFVRISEQLEQIESVEKTDMAGCLSELAGQMGRQAIVIIVSDFFTDLSKLETAVQRLRFGRHEVALLQVMHSDELEFPFDGMARFVGLETPDVLLTRPEDVRRGYLEALDAHQQALGDLAIRNACERVLFDTGRPLGKTLADYLHRRQRVIASSGTFASGE